MEKIFDIAVVGAGPSGLTAAIKAKELAPCANVALIEKMQDAAKKLSASGNGRGNLSNRNCDSCDRVLEFFLQTGIAVRTDGEGRIYPYSEEAKAVSASLVKRAERLGIEMFLNTKVCDVEAVPGGMAASAFLFVTEQTLRRAQSGRYAAALYSSLQEENLMRLMDPPETVR